MTNNSREKLNFHKKNLNLRLLHVSETIFVNDLAVFQENYSRNCPLMAFKKSTLAQLVVPITKSSASTDASTLSSALAAILNCWSIEEVF